MGRQNFHKAYFPIHTGSERQALPKTDVCHTMVLTMLFVNTKINSEKDITNNKMQMANVTWQVNFKRREPLPFFSFLFIHKGGLNGSVILTSLHYKNYTEKLLSYLEQVLLSSERSRFVRCWHAKTDGWAASTFHSNCDGRGPTVTIIKVNDYIFGGYTDVSWGESGK